MPAAQLIKKATVDTDTTLSQEQVEDFAGAVVASGGTKTGITVTYQDGTGDTDFVVDDSTKLPLAGGTMTGTIDMDGSSVEGINRIYFNAHSRFINDMIDDDSFTSGVDAQAVASAESIKAYVDANAGGGGFGVNFGGYTPNTTQNYYYVKTHGGGYYYYSNNFGTGISSESRGTVIRAAQYIATGDCKLTKIQGYIYASGHTDDCIIYALTNDSAIPQVEGSGTIALIAIDELDITCGGSGHPQGFSWDITDATAVLEAGDVVIFAIKRDSGSASSSGKRYYFNAIMRFEEI